MEEKTKALLPCGGFFSEEEFSPEREDEIIHKIRSDPSLTPEVKKELILCWFQVTYSRPGDSTDQISHRASEAIRKYLARVGARSLEVTIQAGPPVVGE